jgi:hypothetical protein
MINKVTWICSLFLAFPSVPVLLRPREFAEENGIQDSRKKFVVQIIQYGDRRHD